MMHPPRCFLALVVATWCWSGASAAEPTAPSVDAVLSALHTEEVLGEASMLFDLAVARRKKDGPLPEAQVAAISNIAKRIYQGKNLLAVFKPAYTKATNRDALAAIYTLLNTPTGIKLRQGFGGITKGGDVERQRYFTEQATLAGKANRLNTLNELNTFANQWGQIEFYESFQAGADLGLTSALNAYAPAGARQTLKAMRDSSYNLRPAYDKPAREFFKIFDFTLFKDMKNEEIDTLAQFATTKAGETHIRAYRKALEYTLEGAAFTLGQQTLKLQN